MRRQRVRITIAALLLALAYLSQLLCALQQPPRLVEFAAVQQSRRACGLQCRGLCASER
jgi:hypothetical protein